MTVDGGEERESAGDIRCTVYVYHRQPPAVTYKLFKLRVAFCQPQSMKAAEMTWAVHKEVECVSERVRHEILTRMTLKKFITWKARRRRFIDRRFGETRNFKFLSLICRQYFPPKSQRVSSRPQEKMEAARSSETSVNLYHTTQHYIPDDSNLPSTVSDTGLTNFNPQGKCVVMPCRRSGGYLRLSSYSPHFSPRRVHRKFVVEKLAALGQGSFEYFIFPLSSFHLRPTLAHPSPAPHILRNRQRC